MIYRMKLADSVDEMTFDLLEVPIEDKDIEGATDNTTIDGNIFTDYLWLKKQFVQKWSLMCKDDYTQLRGFYTRQWENAEAPTYTLFAGQNRSETLTASGSAFRIQNGTQYDAPLTLTELKGNATQNGTPTPDAPVAVQTVSGEQTIAISDGTNTQEYTIDLGSIELAKIGTYQDRIYKNDDKWYIEKQIGKVVLDGTQSIGTTTYTSLYFVYTNQFSGMQYQAGAGLSDYFVYNTNSMTDNAQAGNILQDNQMALRGGSSTDRIYIKASQFADATAFKTWLSTHPTTVYYALATPTTTEITEQALIDQLDFIANLYGGTNNIMLVGTGAQGEIGVEYTLTYEKEQTIIPETTVRLTLTDGGVINTCECRQNVQLTMRETVQ